MLVAGTQAHAEALREEVVTVLAPVGLRLSEAKTKVCHIDEGFDFLRFRIQRRTKRGTTKRVVYTYPSKKALASIKAKPESTDSYGLLGGVAPNGDRGWVMTWTEFGGAMGW